MRLPVGFRVAGVHCGIKSTEMTEDLTLVTCDEPGAVAAGVYTQNVVHASSVALNRERTPGSNFRVVVVNSGNANACTGEQGYADSVEMLQRAAAACNATPDQSLVMSTGIIGHTLPMNLIRGGIDAAAQSLDDSAKAIEAAARGMTTTDRFLKVSERSLDIAGHTVHVSGMAKGAGMIGPNMATLLAIVMTDAALTPDDAQHILVDAADESFNCISVEGHTSTNDTLLLLASGKAIDRPLSGTELDAFRREVTGLCIDLAKLIPADGEGASHLITIRVSGCKSREDAQQIATCVANSALVKTAVTGADPNWGRIISAAGYAGVAFNPSDASLMMNGTELFRDGRPVEFDEAKVSQSIRERNETTIDLQLGEGPGVAYHWTSDLTVEYVKFNSEYTT